jgi:5-methylcytosine-specific restriction endonuclease McrA
MAISKKIRNQIWMKYDKHCAYCGCELEYKNMQPDHVRPKACGGTDEISNLNPSCRDCNNYKGGWGLEEFRTALKTMFNEKLFYLFKSKTKMDIACKFGVINIYKFDGFFYFEKL